MIILKSSFCLSSQNLDSMNTFDFIHADVKIIKMIYFVCIINISLAKFQRHIETAESINSPI